jgi:uncharacterized surface protein with fasciclin (FAS1) repeats
MTTQTQTIAVAAAASDQFKTLSSALKATDLTSVLEGDGPFTVFAPTDAAFGKLPSNTVSDLMRPENKAKLAGILKLHVISGAVMANDVVGRKLQPASVQGEVLNVDGADGVHVNGAKVSMPDIGCSNGVIHGIDRVLMPKSATPSAAKA